MPCGNAADLGARGIGTAPAEGCPRRPHRRGRSGRRLPGTTGSAQTVTERGMDRSASLPGAVPVQRIGRLPACWYISIREGVPGLHGGRDRGCRLVCHDGSRRGGQDRNVRTRPSDRSAPHHVSLCPRRAQLLHPVRRRHRRPPGCARCRPHSLNARKLRLCSNTSCSPINVKTVGCRQRCPGFVPEAPSQATDPSSHTSHVQR
jgi:hypothetical protein